MLKISIALFLLRLKNNNLWKWYSRCLWGLLGTRRLEQTRKYSTDARQQDSWFSTPSVHGSPSSYGAFQWKQRGLEQESAIAQRCLLPLH